MFVFADGELCVSFLTKDVNFDTGIVASPFRVWEFDETVEFPFITERRCKEGIRLLLQC